MLGHDGLGVTVDDVLGTEIGPRAVGVGDGVQADDVSLVFSI